MIKLKSRTLKFGLKIYKKVKAWLLTKHFKYCFIKIDRKEVVGFTR
jgi:hypothetical protein